MVKWKRLYNFNNNEKYLEDFELLCCIYIYLYIYYKTSCRTSKKIFEYIDIRVTK